MYVYIFYMYFFFNQNISCSSSKSVIGHWFLILRKCFSEFYQELLSEGILSFTNHLFSNHGDSKNDFLLWSINWSIAFMDFLMLNDLCILRVKSYSVIFTKFLLQCWFRFTNTLWFLYLYLWGCLQLCVLLSWFLPLFF